MKIFSKYQKLCANIFPFIIVLCCNVDALNEDDPCTQPNGEIGICIPLYGCSSAVENLNKNITSATCGFKDEEALVCCSTYGIKSKKKCGEYHGFNYAREGTLYVGSAVGGEDALSQEFPHMAALAFGEENAKKWLCGGTLISEQYVMTAAHCLYSKDLGEVRWVRLGDLDLTSTTDLAEPQDFEIIERIKHPDYKPPSKYNDIALLKLDRPANFTTFVTPACLEIRTNLSGEIPVATGWGKLSYEGEASPHLQKVYLDWFTLDVCKSAYSSTPKSQLLNGVDGERQMCFGGVLKSKDTCQGDSGGPLQVHNEKFIFKPFNVAGITSIGKGCGVVNVPAVYTRVSYYVPWIEDIIWPD